jgi:hypothetical protein
MISAAPQCGLQALRRLGVVLTAEQLQVVVEHYDADGDGRAAARAALPFACSLPRSIRGGPHEVARAAGGRPRPWP